MSTRDKMELQRLEFDAADAYSHALRRHNLTPVVDDDYPQIRHEYEGALASLIDAMKVNGRFEGANRYGLCEGNGTRVLTCVYCGHEYSQGTPAHGNKVLTDHIRVCEEHPLRAAEATIERLRSALVGIVGESDPESLRAMEAVVRLAPAPDADKAVTLNAIHALLACHG